MDISELNEKVEQGLRLDEKTPDSTTNEKKYSRIPRPTGIKSPSGIPRILSTSVQRPISSPILVSSPMSAPPPQPISQSSQSNDESSFNDKTDNTNDSSMKENIGSDCRNLMTNRSMSCTTTTAGDGVDVNSPVSNIRSRNTQSISRTDNSCRNNQYSSNNSQCAETESQDSSGSRRSSSNFSYISLGDPRMIHAKVNSLANVDHVPGGGNIKIFNQKIDTSKAQAKCGSTANIKYKPGGGNVKIINEKLDIKAESKTKSLKNVKHVPGGGNKTIHNERLPWLKYNAPNLPKEEKIRIAKHKVV